MNIVMRRTPESTTVSDTTVSLGVPQFLLPTGYWIPHQPTHCVPRPRLDALLARCLGHKLLLVVAPAGYGKTTAVLQWVEKQSCAVGWLALATHHDDIFMFTACLVAAIRRLMPDACVRTEMLLLGNQAPAAVLYTTLASELALLARPLVLVLDDYDHVVTVEMQQFMAALINDSPPNVHWVIIARAFPLLPIARWRSHYHLAELHAADLCCAEDETQALLSALLDVSHNGLAEDVVNLVYKRTEGWMAGIRLAALSMRQTSPSQVAAVLRNGNTRNLREYLYDEVLFQQPAQVQEFLLRTSILERFNARLCAAMMADIVDLPFTVQTSLVQIEDLIRKGLFVTQQDEEGYWYRYHHLFAEMLRHRLLQLYAQTEVAQLHCRAAHWFAAEGLIEDAVRHFLAGRAVDLAVETVAENSQRALNDENWRLIEYWLRLLPAAAVQATPALLLAHTFCLLFRFALADIPSLLEQLQSLLQQPASVARPDFAALHAQLCVQRAMLAFFQNDCAAILTHSEAALAQAPAASRYVASTAIFHRALALQQIGRGDEAEQWLSDLLRANYQCCDTFTLRLQFALCTNCRMRGEVDRLRMMAERFLDDAQQGTFHLSQGWARVFLGYTAYEANDLETAAFHFSSGQELIFIAHTTAVRECWIGLMLTRIAQGRVSDAAAIVVRLREFLPATDPLIDAVVARLALAQGDLQTAERWAVAFQLGTSPLLHWQEQPALTAARILIATQKPANLHRALDLLAAVTVLAERNHTLWRRLECTALRAVALELLEQQPCVECLPAEDRAQHAANDRPALALVAELVQIAVPLGFLRLFLDQGDLLPAMVRRLAHDPQRLPAIQSIFPNEERIAPRTSVSLPLSLPRLRVAVQLSPREDEILRLLVEGKTNLEIAQAVWLSTNTVRNHLVKIYSKLGVSNRQGAVALALRLGLM